MYDCTTTLEQNKYQTFLYQYYRTKTNQGMDKPNTKIVRSKILLLIFLLLHSSDCQNYRSLRFERSKCYKADRLPYKVLVLIPLSFWNSGDSDTQATVTEKFFNGFKEAEHALGSRLGVKFNIKPQFLINEYKEVNPTNCDNEKSEYNLADRIERLEQVYKENKLSQISDFLILFGKCRGENEEITNSVSFNEPIAIILDNPLNNLIFTQTFIALLGGEHFENDYNNENDLKNIHISLNNINKICSNLERRDRLEKKNCENYGEKSVIRVPSTTGKNFGIFLGIYTCFILVVFSILFVVKRRSIIVRKIKY